MKSRMLMGIGAALLVGACSGISTSTDYDPQVDFTAFSTYDWVDSEGEVDNITSGRIRQSVDAARFGLVGEVVHVAGDDDQPVAPPVGQNPGQGAAHLQEGVQAAVGQADRHQGEVVAP